MKKNKDLVYIPHQDIYNEAHPQMKRFKNSYTDPDCQYNKLIRQQQRLKNKKK